MKIPVVHFCLSTLARFWCFRHISLCVEYLWPTHLFSKLCNIQQSTVCGILYPTMVKSTVFLLSLLTVRLPKMKMFFYIMMTKCGKSSRFGSLKVFCKPYRSVYTIVTVHLGFYPRFYWDYIRLIRNSCKWLNKLNSSPSFRWCFRISFKL